MNSEIFQRYKRFQLKFNLPHLHELQQTFDFYIEDNEKLFDQIRNEISEKLFVFTEKILEPLVGEYDSFSSLFEQEMLSAEERKRIFDLYKKLQSLKWENNLLSIKSNEKETAEWIKKTWEFWNNELKKELANICKKLSIQWLNIKKQKQNSCYHG